MKIRLFLLISVIYFFFNSFGLPFGLRYTLFLAPLLFVLLSLKYWKFIATYFIFAILFLFIHGAYGIESYPDYAKSFTLHTAVMILAIAFYNKLSKNNDEVYRTIESLTIFNFIATLLCIIAFKIPSVSEVVWRSDYSADSNPQLRMLTYEPSYYCLLLTPLFFYYLFLLEKKKTIKNTVLFGSIILSLLLSRSLGVIAGIILSLSINYINLSFLRKKKNLYLLISGIGIVLLSAVTLIIVNPENALMVRTINFFNGEDISGSARVFDAWVLGFKILEQKSYLFGIGWGHIKILGHNIISDFYNYGESLNKRVSIPNSAAEIFVFFGFFGLLAKIFIEVYLYKKTNVSSSRFRSFLFWFIFIYQFTGSFSSNLAEYVIWIFAFTRTNSFKQTMLREEQTLVK